jgi:hypothetical protein
MNAAAWLYAQAALSLVSDLILRHYNKTFDTLRVYAIGAQELLLCIFRQFTI